METSVLPAIVPLGFMGTRSDAERLLIGPKLPEACPAMTVTDMLYQGCRVDVTVTREAVILRVRDTPAEPLAVAFAEPKRTAESRPATRFVLKRAGEFEFR